MGTVITLPCSLTIQRASLADLAGLWIDTSCTCGAIGGGRVDSLIKTHGGGMVVGDLVRRMRCRECHRPLTIYLVGGSYREPCGGHAPSWSLPLHRGQPVHIMRPATP